MDLKKLGRLHIAQPGLGVQGSGIFPDLEPQLGNPFAIGDNPPDLLVGRNFLPHFYIHLLQPGINRIIFAVIDYNGAAKGGDKGYAAHFPVKKPISPSRFVGSGC